MEEVLTGETQDTSAELERRAAELLVQLGRESSADPKFGIAPKELAATVVRTLEPSRNRNTPTTFGAGAYRLR